MCSPGTLCRLRPLWEELACALLCKCLTRSLCGIKMGRAVWVSRESESKVPKPVLLASDMYNSACIF